MRLRNIPGADEVIERSGYVIKNPESYKGSMQKNFAKSQPLCVEIGMGKGKFIIEQARRNPDKNYIGIEMYSSVLLRAVQKLAAMEQVGESLPNLRLILFDAKRITEIFDTDEISLIYLNFSDPWPKDRHAKRRLPSKEFLRRYDQILRQDGRIEFKTDNRGLFDFALEQLNESPFQALCVTYDLHADEKMNQGNIMTEYEEKFSSMGNPICKYILARR
ncbi:MAG: tRNA (guanosine(46)-N7)-methyltransferase TrmB [Lachnospiraceae bacterium]|nr:tRNA (guanosine(46)-N7)-methyltransferase TrmB [Lachnospiraceae bacterium]